METKPNTTPSLGKLLWFSKEGKNPSVVGQLSAASFLMTAAHCIDKDDKGINFKMPGEFQIVTGEHDWKVNSTHESWHDIKNIVVHSKYDRHAPRYDYDYAIIEVIEPIKLTGHSKVGHQPYRKIGGLYEFVRFVRVRTLIKTDLRTVKSF